MPSPTSRAPASSRSRWKLACSTKQASPRSPAPASAPTAKGTSASPTPTAWRTSRKRSAGWAASSRSARRRRSRFQQRAEQFRPFSFGEQAAVPVAQQEQRKESAQHRHAGREQVVDRIAPRIDQLPPGHQDRHSMQEEGRAIDDGAEQAGDHAQGDRDLGHAEGVAERLRYVHAVEVLPDEDVGLGHDELLDAPLQQEQPERDAQRQERAEQSFGESVVCHRILLRQWADAALGRTLRSQISAIAAIVSMATAAMPAETIMPAVKAVRAVSSMAAPRSDGSWSAVAKAPPSVLRAAAAASGGSSAGTLPAMMLR